ncbi:amino acid adenylation domain-containing protein [Pseudomonadota bacterium]
MLDTISPSDRTSEITLTSLQKAYFMGQRSDFEYHAHPHLYLEFDITDCDVASLESAVNRLILRHPMLRANISDDLSLNIADECAEYKVKVNDFRGVTYEQEVEGLKHIKENLYREKNKRYVPPNIDVYVSLKRESVRVHINLDLLFFDGYSVRKMLFELSEMYGKPGETLNQVKFDFEGYSQFRLDQQQSKRYHRAKNYWYKRLETMAQGPVLPERLQPAGLPPVRSHLVRRKHILTRERWDRIIALSKQFDVNSGSLLFTAYSLVVAAWSKYRNFSVTMMLQNRDVGFSDTTGVAANFASTVLVELDFRNPASFIEYIKAIQSKIFIDIAHSQICGLEILQERNRVSGSTLHAASPVTFVNMLRDLDEPVEPGLFQLEGDLNTFTGLETPQVIIDHQAISRPDGGVSLVWDTIDSVLEDGVCESMFSAYVDFIESLIDDENVWKKECIDFRPMHEKAQHIAYNEVAVETPRRCLHEYLYASSSKYKNKPLIIASEKTLTYGDVLKLSNQIAWTLRERYEVTANELVAIYAEKGWQQVVAAQAIIASGAAYVPIAPGLPDLRKKDVLERCKCRVVLTTEAFASDEVLAGLTMLVVNEEGDWIKKSDILPTIQAPEDLAYVIFTSGSTGTPKGVMLDNYGPVNTIEDINRRYWITEDDTVFGISELNFDLSVYDIFGPMATGASLVIPPPGASLDPALCLQLVDKYDVTIWNSVPALAQLLSECAISQGRSHSLPIRLFMMSGDWIPVHLPDQLREQSGAHIASLGGATEGSIWSIYYDVGKLDPTWTSIPYGYPLANQSIYVLDECMQPRPDNVPGEIYIGGVGVACGYWGDEEKTAKAYLNTDMPAEEKSDLRLYRTGDWGVRRSSGFVDFLGREDSQVKVRGYRIELGEVESTLQQCNHVEGAVVKVNGTGKEAHLVAFIKSKLEGDSGKEILRSHSESLLPYYMIPKNWVFLKEFPLGATGKVDRKSLVVPDMDVFNDQAQQPENELELKVAGLWKELLSLSSLPSRNDNFFDIGGSSFTAVQMAFKIRDEIDVTVSVTDILTHAELWELADFIASVGLYEFKPSVVVPFANRDGLPNAFWFHPSGGNVLCYSDLADRLSNIFNVYGIQAPDYKEVEIPDFDSLVTHYLSQIKSVQPDGPYILSGWSMGGVIAYAAATELQKRGEVVKSLVLIDSPAPVESAIPSRNRLAQWFISDLAESTYLLDAEPDILNKKDDSSQEIFAKAIHENNVPVKDARSLTHLFDVFVKNISLLHSYKANALKANISCLFIRASLNEEERVSSESASIWKEILPTGKSFFTELEGNHYTLLKEPALSKVIELVNEFHERQSLGDQEIIKAEVDG